MSVGSLSTSTSIVSTTGNPLGGMIYNKLTFIGAPNNVAGATNKKEQPCTHFMVGQCKRGDACLYKHEGVAQKLKGKSLGGKQTSQSVFSAFSNLPHAQSAFENVP